MTNRQRVALVVAIGVLLALVVTCVRADEKSEWFRSLKMPTGGSCCDVSDCRPTMSEWRNGRWWAMVNGKWTAIQPEKILKRTSILDEAVVCNSSTGTIWCFVPKLIGL